MSKQEDGNWVGERTWNGRTASIRDVGPETVLQRLLTHE